MKKTGSNENLSTNIEKLRQEIMEDVNKSIQTKVDSLNKKMEEKLIKYSWNKI